MADKKSKKAVVTPKKALKKAAPAKAKPAKKAAPPKAKPAAAKSKVIFFTGFPGFIGKRLVRQLLEKDAGTRFLMLTQEKFLELAKKAVDDLTAEVPAAKTNVELLVGDLTVDGFGFDKATKARLNRDVTEVWHLAAVYDLAVPEKIAWQINVEGTRRMLDLCEGLPKLDKFVYVSTCYVAGLRTGLVVEEDLDCGQGFKNNYESTKFEAEVLVRKRMDKIPTVIIRPSVVVGDSRTGETDKYDGPYFVVRFFADLDRRNILGKIKGWRLPSLGKGEAYFNTVPVDYLVDAMCHIVENPKAIGKTFQIADPDPCTMRELYDIIGEAFGLGKTWGVIPLPVIRAITRAPKLGPFVGMPEQGLAYIDHYAVFDCQNTLEFLKDSNIRCPSAREYTPRMVEYTRQHMSQKGMRAKY